MESFFTPSDLLFLIIVLWIAIMIINGGDDGGHRAKIPIS